MLMRMALTVAERGTCSRLSVGAVLSRDGRIIAMGYNGAPSGVEHCNHSLNEPQHEACLTAVHAEANAIAFAAKHGVATEDSHLHVTHMPCLKCAQLVINAGVAKVTYLHEYRDPSGIVLLESAGVEVTR